MRAILVSKIGGPEQLVPTELPEREPGAGQVRIRNLRASVNFADLKAVAGNYPVSGMPFVPGIDSYGVIDAVGAGVDASWLGKHVVAFVDDGGYAETSTASQGLFFEIPPGVDPDQAGASPLLLGTCYGLLTRAATLSPGDRVLVHSAAGGIGTTAIQMAAALGASTVVGVVSSPEKAPIVEELGAKPVVALGSGFADAAKRAGGGDFQLILNATGGPTVAEDLEVLAPFGTLVAFGMAAGEPGVVRTDQLHPSGRTVAGYSFGLVRRMRPDRVAPMMDPALAMLRDGRIRMVIDSVLGLEEAEKAHRRIASRESKGKILLVP
ncbi:MAG: zinc-binding dehydrogenase [Nitrospiraceae bacterium]|nr:zinc-binding dehydrogenase [Nitrospiraceae bacterium]MDA8262548.1 zinc-binding dehydrogenase [Actinomycetota bacterium]